jgi:hypothetical protein
LGNGSFCGVGPYGATAAGVAPSSDDYDDEDHLLEPTLHALRSPGCAPDGNASASGR